MIEDDAGGDSAFGFSGSWREYAPIAFTNLLLTIVTLGIYSFWAKTRTRRYLWSRTHFIDDRLEWSGTGKELFIGYLLALVCFVLPFGILQLILQGVLFRGRTGLAVLIGVVLAALLLYLIGVAIFRALRYRLSRTWWHGIRGGSDDQGFAYGLSHFWRTLVGYLAIGLLIPWSMTRLWNERWGAMSFGPMRFRGEADWRNIFGRYLLYYFAPTVLFVALFALGTILGGMSLLVGGQPTPGTIATLFIVGAILFFIYFIALGLVAITYYAAFFREAARTLTLGGLRFGFTAKTMDWVLLYLGNVGLTVVTLGIGYIFIPYRNWAFFVRHAEAYGEVTLEELTRSNTRDPGQGEGLLDAFDVGAF